MLWGTKYHVTVQLCAFAEVAVCVSYAWVVGSSDVMC